MGTFIVFGTFFKDEGRDGFLESGDIRHLYGVSTALTALEDVPMGAFILLLDNLLGGLFRS